MNNRKYNCKNPYQGKDKRVLCVCSAGLLRSPTAANVLHAKYGYNTRAVGLDYGHALIPIDDVHLIWADEIVCMDTYQEQELIRRVNKLKLPTPIFVLNIEDSFAYMDKELIEQVKENYNKIFEERK